MQTAPEYTVHIHVGASSISLLITEQNEGKTNQLEYLEQPIPIARDIFRNQKVQRDTIERSVEIIQGYIRVMKEYGIGPTQVNVAAVTNIVNEAKNRHDVLNRLEIATSIKFYALDNGGMTRLIFQKVKRRQADSAFPSQHNTLILHVGPGNTRTLLLKNGQVERYNTYRLGTHRTAESVHESNTSGLEYLDVVQAHCDAQIKAIKYDYRDEQIDYIIVIGYEIQLVAEEISNKGAIENSLNRFTKFTRKCAKSSELERIKMFNLDFHSEDAFLPALQINLSLLKAFNIKQFWIPNTEYEKGILSDLAITRLQDRQLENETLHAAKLLAKKYNVDPKHYEHVSFLAQSIFEQTLPIHGLGNWELHLLKIATIVYEIGGFISPRIHHKHSYYLLMNTEIFGLDEKNLHIIALVSRYHRQSCPKLNHKEYTALSRADQILVSKLSALLRVADALDVSEQQKVKSLTVEKNATCLTLKINGEVDLKLKSLALQHKGDLFEALFGLELTLEHK